MKHIIIIIWLCLTAAIQTTNANTPPPASAIPTKPKISDFAGTWVVSFTNNAKRVYIVSPTGRVTWDGGAEGKFSAQLVERVEGGFVCDFKKDKRCQVFFLTVEKTILVHHWDPISTYKAGYPPTLTGTSQKLTPPSR